MFIAYNIITIHSVTVVNNTKHKHTLTDSYITTQLSREKINPTITY